MNRNQTYNDDHFPAASHSNVYKIVSRRLQGCTLKLVKVYFLLHASIEAVGVIIWML